MRIVLVGAQKAEPECTHWVGIRKGMKALKIDYHEICWRSNSPENVLKQINDLDADLLIWGLIDPFERPDIIQRAKAKKRSLWFAEIRDERTGGYPNWDMRKQIDFIMLSHDGLKELYSRHTKVPVHYIGQAGFEGKRVSSRYSYSKAIFIGGKISGGLFGERYALIQAIDWPIIHINENALDKRMKLYKEMPTIYGTADICFDCSHVWDVEKYCSGRFFHIACNGGFSICKRFPGCEDLFPHGVGKVYFDTPEEATKLFEFYAARPFTRRMIAKRGQEHALKYHTYKNRIEEICRLL